MGLERGKIDIKEYDRYDRNLVEEILVKQEQKETVDEPAKDLSKEIEELWRTIKDLERRIKLLESKNSDGWCNK